MSSKPNDLPADRPHKPASGLARVLIVEDDTILALALEDALTRAGADEVIICSSVEQTMRELESEVRADAIVLDVHLADRNDGWALAELVTMLGARPPQIVFSTGSPESIPDNVAALGPVFVKPYEPEDLVAALVDGRKSGLFTLLRRGQR